MNKRERENHFRMMQSLSELGFTHDECEQLRRISMTLRRWFELECGNSNEYGSWAIERDDEGDGLPYLVHHHYAHGHGKDSTTRTRIADRETGARKRLAKIIAERNRRVMLPELAKAAFLRTGPVHGVQAYIQTDPRGAALYILRPGDVPEGGDVSAYYTRGVCVY